MNPVKALTDYLRSAKAELEKVTWPSRKDTIRYSSLVLGVSVLVAVFFAGLDFGLNRIVTLQLESRDGTTQQQPVADPAPVTPVVPGLDIEPQSGDFRPSDVQVEPTTPTPQP
ncbi:MAG: preprotein translocase subunit SecE [Patescibacteria group bacterium]